MKSFYFRVHYRGRSFDIVTTQHATLVDAHTATARCYPGATIAALDPATVKLATDGLPAIREKETVAGERYRR